MGATILNSMRLPKEKTARSTGPHLATAQPEMTGASEVAPTHQITIMKGATAIGIAGPTTTLAKASTPMNTQITAPTNTTVITIALTSIAMAMR